MAHFASYNTSDATSGAAPLAANASITPIVIQTGIDAVIAGIVISDQAGTLHVDQSFDGINWDYSATYNVVAGTGTKINEDIIAPLVQVRYTNSATNQTYLRLFLRAFGSRSN